MSRLIIIGGERPVAAEFMGFANATIPCDFGPESGARSIICAIDVSAAQNANPSLISATIGGTAASIFTGAVESPGNINTGDIGVYWIGAKPTGTSGVVTATFSATAGSSASVWRVMNLRSLTPVDVAASVVPSQTTPYTINADAQAGGIFLGAGRIMRDSGTAFFSAGVTEDYNQVTGHPTVSLGGHSLITANETNRALTIAMTGTPAMRGAIAAVSLR